MPPGECTDAWPEPEPGQIAVMLLGTYHMDNPGLDTVNIDADDVLAPKRQAELEDLVDRLAPWEPDRVAVERPTDSAEPLNECYDSYRLGAVAYGDEVSMEALHPRRTEMTTESRSEVIQIGFRLAERCSHERVYPVDSPMSLYNEQLEELEADGFEPPVKADVDLPDFAAMEAELERELVSSTIREYLVFLNQESALRQNHLGMFGDLIRRGRGANYGGPDALATWYTRNLRIVHHVWRAVEVGDERVLVLVGSGHVRVLRQLFAEVPQFVPVSPLSLLTER